MQALIDLLERMALPSAFTRGVDLATLVDRVQRAYLRRALGVDRGDEGFTPEDLAMLRRLALYLEAETTFDRPQDQQELQDALYVAATIFEFLGQYTGLEHATGTHPQHLPERLATGDLADYTRALMLYSLGRHESNSAVIGRRLLEAIVDDVDSRRELGDEAVIAGLRVIVALVSRDLRRAVKYGAELGEVLARMREEWRGLAFPIDDGLFLAAWLEIAEAATTVAVGLLKGSEEILSKGRARLTAASERAITLRHSFAFWAADMLGLIVGQMQEHSVFQVLRDKGLPHRYLTLLAATGSSELWSSQLAVVEAGLLEDDRPFAINLPTGAGKSLIAEMVLVKSLLSEAGAWGLYLVPSRALVHQVVTDLRRRLPLLGATVRTVIAGAEPAGILEDELAEIAAPQTLTILTPEKLDVYFRNQPEIFKSCRLLIVDEAHKIGDLRRGALVDTLLTRFRLLVPTARLLLLSAVLSNVLEIANWLDHPEGGVRNPWRPTRQLKGLAVRHDETITTETRVVSKKSRRERVTKYDVGVVLIHRVSELRGGGRLEVDLPRLFSGKVRAWKSPKTRRTKTEGPTGTDHAIALAARFARLSGVTVVFLGQKSSAERCAREIAAQLTQDIPQHPMSQQLSEHLALLLGPAHPLPRLTLQGVAYHHADLPTPVRRAIESALREGIVRVVCATATLQEGLNTPATTVIIAGAQRYDVETDTNH